MGAGEEDPAASLEVAASRVVMAEPAAASPARAAKGPPAEGGPDKENRPEAGPGLERELRAEEVFTRGGGRPQRTEAGKTLLGLRTAAAEALTAVAELERWVPEVEGTGSRVSATTRDRMLRKAAGKAAHARGQLSALLARCEELSGHEEDTQLRILRLEESRYSLLSKLKEATEEVSTSCRKGCTTTTAPGNPAGDLITPGAGPGRRRGPPCRALPGLPTDTLITARAPGPHQQRPEEGPRRTAGAAGGAGRRPPGGQQAAHGPAAELREADGGL